MNEKIKELLEEVGGHGSQALLHPDDVEKFALLVINECLVACATDALGKTVSPEFLINKHFGID